MIPYNPSSFDRNKTILEQILELKNWLKEHPSYKVYQCFANYMPNQFTSYAFGQLAGDIQTIEAMAVGDVVFFADSYYAVITAVDLDNQDFDIQSAVSFKGPQGPAGTNGVSVTTATINGSGHLILTLSDGTSIDAGMSKGADGTNGTNGTDGKYISNASVDGNGDLICTIYDPATSTSSTINAGHVVGPQGTGIQIVALTSISGTLSADDLSKVTGTDDCIITYTNAGSTMVFKRASIDSSYAYFSNVVVDNDTYYLYCEVDVTTGQYDLGVDQLPIKASNVNSGTATNGQILTADGIGGASWQSASGGNLYIHCGTISYTDASYKFYMLFNYISKSDTRNNSYDKMNTQLYNMDTAGSKIVSANGIYNDITNNKVYKIVGIYRTSAGIYAKLVDDTGADSNQQLASFHTFNDTILQVV